MKKAGSWIIVALMAMILLHRYALADGGSDWHYSRVHGYTRLASYVGEYDGYVCVDGMGGVTAADEYSVTVISKSASIWAEPRTNSRKLASAAHGESIPCRSDDGGESLVYENGFYGVEYKGMPGWINEDYVVNNELRITLLESNVPAYSAPDTQSKKVGSLSKLTEYRVIGFYDDFYIVNLRGAAAAFIPMSVRHRDNTFERSYHAGGGLDLLVTAEHKTILRTGPGRSYPEIRTVRAGTELRVVDIIDDWTMIYDEETNQYAFIAPDSLDIGF
ncbi:MAG: SH3 domain-containing protein [Clostridia bacterium]|nr:SH3 domain-containing protein [Clostridia bacterium]